LLPNDVLNWADSIFLNCSHYYGFARTQVKLNVKSSLIHSKGFI